MTSRLHRGSLASSPPLWLRAIALFCLLLIAGSSTAQAAHIHGEWLPNGAKHASLPANASQGAGEEHCPLCVAMHSALPATLQVIDAPLVVLVQTFVAGEVRAPESRWSFALFCRPPPVASSATSAG